jgi:hypothetical protein
MAEPERALKRLNRELTMDEYMGARIIYALGDELNVIETYSNMENVGKDALKANPSLILLNFDRSKREFTHDQAKTIVETILNDRGAYRDLLKTYGMKIEDLFRFHESV